MTEPAEQLERALHDLTKALDASGVAWMVIGGIAVAARGVRRFTADIDAAVRADGVEIDQLVAALAKRKIKPRIEDAAQFARESLVLLMRHTPSGVDLDIALAWTEFEHEAISSATRTEFGSVEAPMARPEDLVVFKSIAGRGKDLDDIVSLLTLYPKLDLVHARRRVRELAALADAPELSKNLESAIASAKAARKPSRRKHPKPSGRPSAKPKRVPKR